MEQEKFLGKTISKKDADKDSFEDVTNYKKERSYSEEEVLAFGKSCFYKGFDKAENDDANCYTAFREEIGGLFEQFKKILVD